MHLVDALLAVVEAQGAVELEGRRGLVGLAELWLAGAAGRGSGRSWGTKERMQRSPGLTVVNALAGLDGPCRQPRVRGRAGAAILAVPTMKWWSLAQRPAAPIWTSTSPDLGGS